MQLLDFNLCNFKFCYYFMFFFLPLLTSFWNSYYHSIFLFYEFASYTVYLSLSFLVIIIEIAACFLNLPKSNVKVSCSFTKPSQ